MTKPANLFILHDAKDYIYLKSLERQLEVLKTQGFINTWSSDNIIAGTIVNEVTSGHLASASIVLALISADYLSSKTCMDIQQTAFAQGKTIIPVVVRNCLWNIDPILQKFDPLPKDNGQIRPVSNWPNSDDAFTEVASRIMELAIGQPQPINNDGSKDTANKPKIRTILFMGANPVDTNRLRLDEEVREIRNKIRRGKEGESLKFEQEWAVRTVDLQQHFQDYQPNIVHFSGHGSGEKGLVFEDKVGNSKMVEAPALEGLFELFSDCVKCVLLNACYSKTQAEAISKHIPYVIGMNNKVPDEAAIAFSEGFYLALGGGHSFKKAFEFGKNNIQLQGLKADWIPELLSHS